MNFNYMATHNSRNPRNAGAKPIGSERRQRTNIMLDTQLKAKANSKATELGLSLSQLINDAISAYLSP